ncbi:NAD-dependent epimerase/dehydratase family protein [Candidatus Pelagibacter communis]|uniref:NAD-dependent epimerase/dehydratase family protein n=1 Tax=Pelagibacter ubique TaxID=198252 RepID=UPI0003FC7206|nr:NAD-dependent epimerase/dehydratase family protein [Candidatus Pelagibacter ubique]
MKKNYIVVTGGAGFIGSNLIKYLINKTKFNIISLDNYSTGNKKNEIKDKRIKYIKSDTKKISKTLNLYKKNIHSLFHFGEFSRIYQSFLNMSTCIESNTIGSNEVFNFCLLNKIKLIYSATSASIGNKGDDKNLSPYAFTKAKNLELLENLKKWFNFKYEIIYFYNVYGPGQIKKGSMATVIGIFEDQFKKKIPLTIVRPGSQSRRFTHVFDTVEGCYFAWKKNMCKHYSVSHKKSYTIIEVAKMFNSKVKFLPSRKGERYASALTNMNFSNKVYKIFGKINLKDHIINIVKNTQKRP